MPFIVVDKAAHMPQGCWTGKGRYRKIAVLEVDEGVTTATMISTRARGVRRVVKVWDKVYRTPANGPKCAANIALEEAEEMAEALNEEEGGFPDEKDVLDEMNLDAAD